MFKYLFVLLGILYFVSFSSASEVNIDASGEISDDNSLTYEEVQNSLQRTRGSARVPFLEALSLIYLEAGEYESAIPVDIEVLSHTKDRVIMIDAMMRLSLSYRMTRQYADSLSYATKALRAYDTAPNPDIFDENILIDLFEMQSHALMCHGDVFPAVGEAVRGLKKAQDEGVKIPNDYVLHVIDTIMALATKASELPEEQQKGVPAILAMNQQLRERLTKKTYNDPFQLPKHYVPGLPAKPFLPPAYHPTTAFLATNLEGWADRIAEEAERLYRNGTFTDVVECLYTSKWEQFNVDVGPSGMTDELCEEAPVACEMMLNIIGQSSIKVIRYGYSAISHGAHIRSHFGASNAMLKAHLPVKVPLKANNEPCSSIRVEKEKKSWKYGEVLLFDDSFEHDVSHVCEEPRIVFQVIFLRPEIKSNTASYFEVIKNLDFH